MSKDKLSEKRYGAWAGNPKGRPYNPEQCAEEVSDRTGWHFYQCNRIKGFGKDGLYCKQHAKKNSQVLP